MLLRPFAWIPRRIAAVPSRGFAGGIYKDPNFPMTDGRVHHLDVTHGEVANRVLSVGDAARGERVAQHFDGKKYFKLVSHRGFVVYTGLVSGVPVTIAVTGMGTPMMDFVVRELRAVVDGPMAMLRYGTCGGFGPVKPGDVVVAKDSVFIRREPDYFASDKSKARFDGTPFPPHAHSISQAVPANIALTSLYAKNLTAGVEAVGFKVHVGKNATADYFYDSQARIGTAFQDDNKALRQRLKDAHPDARSCEMETFHLLHLAHCSKGSISAAAAAMTIANRDDPASSVVAKDDLEALEFAGGKAALLTLSQFPLDVPKTQAPDNAVWTKF